MTDKSKKNSKPITLRIKELVIKALSDDELREVIKEEKDDHLKQAYMQMLENCEKHTEDRIWYTLWLISLKSTSQKVGSIGFLSAPENGAVEIGYGIDEPYQSKGYATQALKVMCDYAFSVDGVIFVTAKTEDENIASKRVLEKNGFINKGTKDETALYELEKPSSAWLSIYMCLGMSVGMCFGVSFDNLALGMCFGLGIGTLLGIMLDDADRKKRKKIIQEREQASKENEESD